MYIRVAQCTSSELLLILDLKVHEPNNINALQTAMYKEQTKKRPNTVSLLIRLVEARGVEPLSENIAT
jgi:hypothetical protein